MSIAVQAQVWRLKIPTGEKLLLLALADFSNNDGTCYPGQARLADMCSVTDRAIRDQLNKLIKRGLVEKIHRSQGDGGGRKSNLYRLILPGTLWYNLKNAQPEDSSGWAQPEVHDTPTGSSRHPTGSQLPPNHKREPSEQNHESKRTRATYFDLEALPKDWYDFIRTVRPDLNAYDTFEDFRDHWISTDKNAKKRDWLATWRRWVRSQHATTNKPGQRGSSPRMVVDNTMPRDDAQLESWARRNGRRQPRPGESYGDYRRALMQERTHA